MMFDILSLRLYTHFVRIAGMIHSVIKFVILRHLSRYVFGKHAAYDLYKYHKCQMCGGKYGVSDVI